VEDATEARPRKESGFRFFNKQNKFVDLRRETFIPVLLSQPPMQRAKEEDKTERVGGNGKFCT